MRQIDAAVRSQRPARRRARGIRWGAFVLASVVPTAAVTQQPAQKTFASAEQASESLFAAVQSDNQPALLDLFGPAGQDIIASGDSTEDAHERAQFVRKYREMHRLAKDSTGETVIYIGAENWPLPIPLVEADGVWHFDTEAGKNEILFRRIGRNELAAIRVCHALVDAERDYFASAHAGITGKQYASRFVSDSGKEDGLYWKGATDQSSSPIGPLLAQAAGTVREAPFHGYYYHLLTRQGASAPGGAKSYLVDGKLTGGFAFVAWPAEYQSSGVMTFIVSQADVVYQKDLGADSDSLAATLPGFDPDSSWHEAEP
jgi:hypothetical protein